MESIKDMDIAASTKERVDSQIDSKVIYYSSLVDKKCKEVLETIINEKVKEKISSLFMAEDGK